METTLEQISDINRNVWGIGETPNIIVQIALVKHFGQRGCKPSDWKDYLTTESLNLAKKL